MEYSINNVFINVFGEHELSVILGSDSHIVQGNSEKLHSKLIKLKDKLLIDLFEDIGKSRNASSINDFYNKNDPIWRKMTSHVLNVLVNKKTVFEQFQKILETYRDHYPLQYKTNFQNRKEYFHIFYRKDMSNKDSCYYDTLNDQALDKKLQNIIKKLSAMDDENAFEYMVFLFILISIFHDTLTSNTKLQYLYNENYIIKYVRYFPLTSSEPLWLEWSQQ